jgi:hypothetical protein
MKFRAPAYPLITVDPYFSVWCMADTLYGNTTKHWTGKPNTMLGIIHVDGKAYTFMGEIADQDCLQQVDCTLTALSTTYIFEGAGVRLTARFTTPILMDDLKLLSRPISFLELKTASIDGRDHQIVAEVSVSEEICLNTKGQYPVKTSILDLAGHATAKIGSIEQPVLAQSGDDLRIDWGYFYLSIKDGCSYIDESEDMTYVKVTAPISINGTPNIVAFAYDDCYSIEYFGKRLKSLWNQEGTAISDAIVDAFKGYETVIERCDQFDKHLQADAIEAGGVEYADLLNLTYRQTIAAHKLAVDENGEILWISKECFSNGCAATVDVTYPSIPLFLLYNTEMIKGMLRPIFKYAESALWEFDFAPHDVGQYPLLNGQVYCENKLEGQMPVEECGNMILTVAAVAVVDGNAAFASRHMPTLEQWLDYLCSKGLDPENQLCTDDFAGHLAHNCNLSLKAICAIGSFSRVYQLLGEFEKAERCIKTARNMAAEWTIKAANNDGSFRLAFDCPDTFSMKYNMVWDKLMKLQLFHPCVMGSEIASYACHMRPYGLPLDNRSDYTKSDWLVWTAAMASSIEQFKAFIHPLWLTYHLSPSRVPATDWYFATTSLQTGFQNRTVQGGLFMKLLDYKGLENHWKCYNRS